MIHLAGISYASRGRPRLAGIDLQIAQGECVGVSAVEAGDRDLLLQIIATLVRPSGGRMVIDGIDAIARVSQARRRVGFAGAAPLCPGELTVLEYLQVTGAARGGRRGRTRAESLVAHLGLPPHARAAALDRGGARGLAIGAAVVGAPPVVVIAEGPPAGAPDEAWVALLRQVSQEGTTLILACDIDPQMDALCARAIRLEAGRLRHESAGGMALAGAGGAYL